MNDQPKILLVINEASRRVVAAAAAAEQGVVIEAKNCEEGRCAVARNADIAVILSDLTLSDGNWWCLHRAVVENQSAAEVIVLMPMRDSDASAIEAYGAIAVSADPLTEQQVAQAISEALRRRQRVGRGPF